MNKILLVFLASFLIQSYSVSQPSEEEFLNGVINSAKASNDFTFSFNQQDDHKFDSSATLTGKINLNLRFNSTRPNRVTISNKTFKGFKDISFSIENAASIKLSNCIYINCGTVHFEFGKENNLYDSLETNVKIENCEFTDTDLKNDKSDYSYQLYFKKEQAVGKEKCLIKNVEISDCHFYLNDTANSFLTKNKLLPSRYSVFFMREDNNVAVSNITVSGNNFKMNAPYYRTFGIVFLNNGNSIFRAPNIPIEDQFHENNTLKIQNNYLKTVSNDPGHGIFVQGPYENVRITDNEVLGFGANFPSSDNSLQRDGAVQLYGGRAVSRYSNDLQNCDVSYNKVNAVGTGIRLSGTYNATVNYNEIEILPDPAFYVDETEIARRLKTKFDQAGINCRTGNSEEPERQTRDLRIENNIINCNRVDRCIGIDIDAVKSFSIRNNRIYKPNNYGIIYHSNKGFVEQEFGNSVIENNLIDFGNQKVNDLKSNWYVNYGMKYSGINISRDFSENQKQIDFESLLVRDNIIKMISDSGIDPIRIEKIKSMNEIVKTKFYNVDNNFLQTKQELMKIPNIDFE